MSDDLRHPPAAPPDAEEADEKSFSLLNDYWEALNRGEDIVPEAWRSLRPEAAEVIGDLDIVAQLHEARLRIDEDSSFEPPPTVDNPVVGTRLARPLLPPGTKLGSYLIQGALGRGGMGEVYVAEHEIMRQKFAVKVLADHLADRPGLRQRFRREIETLSALNHENIVAAKYADEAEGRLFLVMEYVAGINLHDHVMKKGPLQPLVACNYILQAARGLEYAHRNGVVHRDIKPSNLLLTAEGSIKILDVGLARIVAQGAQAADASLSASGALVGTLNYIAPELLLSAAQANDASDLYSLGCTFYWLLTAETPFNARSAAERLGATRMPVAQLRPEVPVRIAAIVEKLLADNPEDRYPSAHHLTQALETILSPPAGPGRTPTIVRSDLPDGSKVTVSVEHGSSTPAKLSVSISKQELTKRRRRRRMAIQVSLAFAVVLLVIGYFRWASTRTLRQLPGPELAEEEKQAEQLPPLALTEPKRGLDAPTADPGVSQADRDLVARVSRRLWAVIDRLPDFALPPSFEITNKDQVNAFAIAKLEKQANKTMVRPRVLVTSALLEHVVRGKDDPEGQDDRLAFILSHELGHVALAHIVRPPAGETTFLQQAFNRQQEIDADLKGMELALKAGYSFRRGLTAIDRMKQLGLNYSSFEGLGADHPSWNDRLTLLDKEQSKLWKAMSAFETGVFFLHFEQYASAERCFREVVQEFPECYEGWANLGDALLMQYCDALDLDDLRRLNVGQIALPAFYTRPESLEAQVRGNDDLWTEAVAALEKALKLKGDLVLAKANLGVAYLVSPHGKDVKRATDYLDEAADKVVADRSLSSLMRATVLINAGAADLAAGHIETGEKKLLQAADIVRRGAMPEAAVTVNWFCALLYNRAMSLALSPEEAKRRGAVEVFEQYLKTANPDSTWWSLGYERYSKLCNDLNLKAKTKQQLANQERAFLRAVTSVKLASGNTVALSESMKEAVKRLGEGQETPVVRGTKLVRWRFPAQGIELIGTDRVIAIILRSPKAPALRLQGTGPGGQTKQLSLGMTQQELEQVLADEEYDLRQLDQADVGYRFYAGLGLAVRAKDGKIEELSIALLSRRPVQQK